MLLFLNFGIKCTELPEPRIELHDAVLKTLVNGGKLLDVGCMFGQDMRKLVHDGAPVSSVYGTDQRDEYFELGYRLFRDDRVIPKDHFIKADIMDPDSELRCFEGEIDVVANKDLMHCFDYAGQIELAVRFVALLRPRAGSRVVGQVVGHVRAGNFVTEYANSGLANMYLHNEESFARLWEEVGRRTGSRWRVESRGWKIRPAWEPVQIPGQPRGPNCRYLLFAAERL